jgi:hypothetical protein
VANGLILLVKGHMKKWEREQARGHNWRMPGWLMKSNVTTYSDIHIYLMVYPSNQIIPAERKWLPALFAI